MLLTSFCALSLLSLLHLTSAHTVITYPGWRGDNLHSNGTVFDTNGLNGAVDQNNSSQQPLYPYGMQWSYPCGGMPTSTNRTKWPITGGALAFQPGWFAGHGTAFIYINMGYGSIPPNMSNVILNGIQLIGPSKEPYPGSWCFPQLPLPANSTAKVGDNATIQIIETAVHGAALYNCVDITFAEAGDPEVAEVNASNCFNSSQISSNLIFTTTSLTQDTSAADGLRSSVLFRFGWVASVLGSILLGYFLL